MVLSSALKKPRIASHAVLSLFVVLLVAFEQKKDEALQEMNFPEECASLGLAGTVW